MKFLSLDEKPLRTILIVVVSGILAVWLTIICVTCLQPGLWILVPVAILAAIDGLRLLRTRKKSIALFFTKRKRAKELDAWLAEIQKEESL